VKDTEDGSVYSTDIPQFANFDDPTTSNHTNGNENNGTTTGIHTSTRRKNDKAGKGGKNSSNGRSSSRSGSSRRRHSKKGGGDTNNEHQTGQRSSPSGVYDQNAATDSKWAKFEANNPTSSNQHQHQHQHQQLNPQLYSTDADNDTIDIHMKSSTPNRIRRPSAGLIRTSSITGAANTTATSNATNHHKSVTPVKRNASRIKNPANHTPSSSSSSIVRQPHKSSLRTRSRSPIPTTTTTTNNNNNRPTTLLTPQHRRTSSTSNHHSQKKKKSLTKQELQIKRHYEQQNYAFQLPGQLVDSKTIDLASRNAFEPIRIMDIHDLRSAAEARSSSVAVNDGSTGLGSVEGRIAKMSPPVQHLEVLDKIYNVMSTRQLCWSPSVSCEADPFYGWNVDTDVDGGVDGVLGGGGNDTDSTNNNIKNINKININTNTRTNIIINNNSTKNIDPEHRRKTLLEKKRRRIAAERYGWYKQIDAITYVNSTLPKHTPPLTNIRRRLPMRSDVGFPGATEEEFMIKQEEIAKEAELEEISPRLIIMITSDCTGSLMGLPEDDLLSPSARDALEHRLPGMPFAGKELAMTAFRNRTANTSSLDRDTDAYNSNSDNSIADTTQYDELQPQRKPVPIMPAQPKPNPTSLFSPPIDATFSSSEMWRARPFADRPVGMVNILVFPLTVQFAVGDIEPLVCTLALYCLPTTTSTKGMTGAIKKFRGKISEDFCFPGGGKWKGLLEERAGKLLARQFGFGGGGDESYGPMGESYGMDRKRTTGGEDDGDDDGEGRGNRRRVKKAMFSYDPEAIPPSSEDPTGRDSLYIVMQVHKVTHKEATSAYVNTKASSKGKKEKERDASQPKGGRSFGMSKSKDTVDTMSNALAHSHRLKSNTEIKAGRAFDALGTQFLTPLCFGILPLFPLKSSTTMSNDTNTSTNSETMHWPNGVTQDMTIFSQPTKPESEEDFVARLIALSEQQITNTYTSTSSIDAYPPQGSSTSLGHDTFDASLDNARDFAVTTSTSFRSTGSGESSASRWFGKMGRKTKVKTKSKNKYRVPVVKKSVDLPSSQSTSSLSGFSPIDGNALFFTSVLGVDFTSVLLESPSYSKGEGYHDDEDDEPLTPRLFVDASGDSAIMVNPESRGSSVKKRSNLIRLPPAVQPSGYSDSCEVREVMYLRPPLHYDADLPSSPRTPVNVLFLYPRLIRYSPDVTHTEQSRHDHVVKNSSYSVRLRLVEQSMAIDEGTGVMEAIYSPVESIYNPSPGGPPLLQATFTKIPLSCTLIKGSHTDFANGIPLRDEVKLRLPDILDGSHFIQFTLFAIHLVDESNDDSNGGLVQTHIAETLIPLSSSNRKSTSGVRVTTVIPNGLHRIKIADFQFQLETRLASTIHISDPEVATVIRDFPVPESASNVEGRKAIANFSNMLSKASTQAVTNLFLSYYTYTCVYLSHKEDLCLVPAQIVSPVVFSLC